MIKSFKDKETEKIFNGIASIKYNAIQSAAKRKLDMLHFAYAEKDLTAPPANRFEHLKGSLKGYCSIRINNQFRLIFQFKEGNAENVYIDDYHK